MTNERLTLPFACPQSIRRHGRLVLVAMARMVRMAWLPRGHWTRTVPSYSIRPAGASENA